MEKEKNIFEQFEEKHKEFFDKNGGLSSWYSFSRSVTEDPIRITFEIKKGLPEDIHKGLLAIFPSEENQ